MDEPLPLEGVTVLDLTRLLPGPYTTQLLGDMGADVVKIEEPTVGDYFREQEPQLSDGNAHVFATLNRNKQSVALDLKDERGREAFFELVEEADAVVEQFRPGVVDRLGIDYETLAEHNDELVYCSLTGYGQSGPYEQWVGHDINYIGIGGLLGMTGQPGDTPDVPGVPVADYAGGMMLAFTVLTGLWRAKFQGKGGYYDVSMADVIVSWLSLYAPFALNEDAEVPPRGGTQPAGKYPCYDVFECADGEYITLGAMEFKFWETFCEAVGLEEYATPEDQYAEGERLAEVRRAVEDTFAQKTVDAWMDHFDPTAVPVAPVNSLAEMWEDPQVSHREMVRQLETDLGSVDVVDSPIKASGMDTIREAYPGLGEHSREILLAAGLSEERFEELVDDGVTREAERSEASD